LLWITRGQPCGCPTAKNLSLELILEEVFGAVGTRYSVTHKRRAELTDLFAQEALTIQPICRPDSAGRMWIVVRRCFHSFRLLWALVGGLDLSLIAIRLTPLVVLGNDYPIYAVD
jgi:hypothetical protein